MMSILLLPAGKQKLGAQRVESLAGSTASVDKLIDEGAAHKLTAVLQASESAGRCGLSGVEGSAAGLKSAE